MYLISFFALIFFAAFFAVSEISLAAAKRIRLQALADEGNHRAAAVLRLQENPGHFFTVNQIGINAVALAGGILGERLFNPFFIEIASQLTPNTDLASTVGFWIGFVTSTVLFILFADLIPKRIAVVIPERIAMTIIGPMTFLIKLFPPVIWVFNGLANVFIRLLGLPAQSTHKITSEDIVATVDAGAAAGIIASEEQAVIENIFELDNRTVPSAMTPRENIDYLLLDDSEEEIREKILKTEHSKFLVCDNELDNMIGIVECKDLLKRMMTGQALNLKETGLVTPLPVVPDSLTLSDMLDHFKQTHTDIAVIINEYALVVGVITLNDVMSTVMGDLVITDEESQIIERDKDSWLIDGATPIDDIEHALDIYDFPDASAYETIAGFMMYMLRKIPKRTDRVIFKGYRFEVIDVDNNRIDQILVTKIQPTESSAEKTEETKEAPTA